MAKTRNFIELNYLGGCYAAPALNDVWNVPEGVDEIRGEMETVGPWGIVRSYKALATSCDFGPYSTPMNAKCYGMRTLTNCKESGHELEGKVSIGGKKYRAFTSSSLFQRADGSLVDVAVLHVCFPKGKE